MNTENSALIDRIDALEGKVLGAHAAIRALIACHPRPEKAIGTVCEHLDRFAAAALADTLPEEMVQALASAERSILPTDDEINQAQH